MVGTADAPTSVQLPETLIDSARKFIAVYKNEKYSISESMEKVRYLCPTCARDHVGCSELNLDYS